MIKRATVNFIVDLVSLIAFVTLTLSGFAIKFMPHGRGRGFRGGEGPAQASEFLMLDRHEWGEVHYYTAYVFVALILIHIILHWTWIKCYFQSILRPQECEE